MTADKIIRTALWISVPFNFLAAYSVAFPASFTGQLMGLPFEVPASYSVLLAWMIALFGAVYAWLAMQKDINRGLVGVAAIGKAGVFVNMALLWLSGHAAGMTVLFTAGDMAFVCVFAWWLLKTARYVKK